ncbi:uncharacterized protein PgNI_03467 [Pyricularia grisea]|uniref:Uncharacterized protein n=1 Tax=Pyricularia grisea TaxID=148305 RepID=A0A6P8BE33_PYRGI|nr:uncharacterized protein PgNI_03467 [Pyricularia grisea]TLD13962.1 hypothetical protein PgNI_03467 [Pyricularia grisea]
MWNMSAPAAVARLASGNKALNSACIPTALPHGCTKGQRKAALGPSQPQEPFSG